MEKTIGSIGRGSDVSVTVENRETVAVLERSLRSGRSRGFRRNDGVDDKLHGLSPDSIQIRLLAASIGPARLLLRHEAFLVASPWLRPFEQGSVEREVIIGHAGR